MANEVNNTGTCLSVEALLAEYIEDALPQADHKRVEAHVQSCTACAELVADMRHGMALCREADEVMVPPRLVPRILEKTTGKLTWKQKMRAWVRPVLEPKLALGLAMALISLSMIARASGVDVTQLSLADLRPSSVYTKMDRRVRMTATRVVKYYSDLRVVYEIQTQLQAIRESTPPAEQEKRREEPSRPNRPAQNRGTGAPVYVASFISLR